MKQQIKLPPIVSECPHCGKKIEQEVEAPELPTHIGFLNTIIGINGYRKAGKGHFVFAYKDRYQINLEPLNGGEVLTVPYYKETLTPFIDFI